MKAVKIVVTVLAVYVGIVVAFEASIGVFQPMSGSVLVITTFDEEGTGHDRVVSRLESDGQLYVAANHWPRAWYARALEHPEVRITQDGQTSDRRAVPVATTEHERVEGGNRLHPVFRFVTGFPPRAFLRLDPP